MRQLIVAAAVVALACTAGAGSVAARQAPHERATGTFSLQTSFNGLITEDPCPAGVPSTTACYLNKASAAVPGLGQVEMSFVLFLDNSVAECPQMSTTIALEVAGKGEIHLQARNDCAPSPPLSAGAYSLAFTAAGGSGAYALATGEGTLDVRYVKSYSPSSVSFNWAGSLTVPGVAFDLTPPAIQARNLTVKTSARAARVRVRYSASAHDDVDGPLRALCHPRSGSLFRVGRRTKVSCTATDSSANTATASFTVAVKRKPRR